MPPLMTYDASTKHMLRREAVVIFKLLLPLLGILAVVGWFHEFVWHAILANVAINGLIITAASYGVVMIVIRLVGAQIDFMVIERFGREAMQGVYMRQLLEEPWLKKRYVRHYLGHIALTGGTVSSAMEQNAIENELRALTTEYEHKLELPQFIVGFMIAMGLLGTFIGLLETLTGISGMLDGFGGTGSNMDEQFMKLVVELRKPLAGMGIAFSASMFGLVTSLMLAMMMISLRRYIGRVVSCARNVMHDLTEMTRSGGGVSGGSGGQLTPEEIAALGKADGRKAAGASIAEGEMTLQDLVYQSHDTNLMMAARIDGLTQKIEKLFQVIEGGVQATMRTNDLLGFGPRMKELNEKMLDEMRLISGGYVEQQKLTQRMIETNGDSARALDGLADAQRAVQLEMIGAFKDFAAAQRDVQMESREAGDRMLNELRGVAAVHIEQQKLSQRFIDTGAESSRALDNIAGAQREAQAALTASFRDMISAARQNQIELSSSFKGLAEKLENIESSNHEVGKHLWDIKESFKKVGAYSEVGEAISTGIGHQTLLLETLIKEDRNLQKRLISIQQDLRERTLPPADGGSADPTLPVPM